MNKATQNMLGAVRDLVTLQQWISSGHTVPPSELISAAHRVDRTIEIWTSEGCPNAPESLELESR